MKNTKHINYAKTSFILAIAPITVLCVGFLFCSIGSGGGISDNDGGAIWWLFIALLWILIPIVPVASVASITFGIKSLKESKTLFALFGIGISSLELLGILFLVT